MIEQQKKNCTKQYRSIRIGTGHDPLRAQHQLNQQQGGSEQDDEQKTNVKQRFNLWQTSLSEVPEHPPV